MCRKPLIEPPSRSTVDAALMEAIARGGPGLQDFFTNELRGDVGS
jgi:hypothetical protein